MSSVQSSSPETTAAAVAATLAAEIAAASTATIDTSLLSPFPSLPDEQHPTALLPPPAASAFTAATAAAAISSAMASAQLGEAALTSAPVTAFEADAHDQVIEIMNSYQQTNAHRRRSSVEAAAAASSVLASIANSNAKGYPGDHHGGAQQNSAAAAALLAASGMHGVVLPTIPSESASLRNTPGPGESFDTAQFAALQSLQQQQQQQQHDNRPPPLNISSRGKGGSYDDDDSLSDDEKLVGGNGMPLTPDAPGSGRPGSLRHLTPDERRARRLQRNRLAAKECRQKKKAYIGNLEAQVADLQEENAGLRKELEELHARLTLSAMRSSSSATTPTLDIKMSDIIASAAEDPSNAAAAAKRARISGD
ncbi:hypothetical protein LPJ53_003268 [Coemansia erecta]|uniref:BZIP domain-containing protein n=1 Tax=Coemansia erecta TaxID=147472 RepID=A0A9W7Y1K9_9FUNG|nr:hypothetical protein LPJ53_003268 [Coemansia erecta]